MINTMKAINEEMSCLDKNQIPTIEPKYHKLRIHTSQL